MTQKFTNTPLQIAIKSRGSIDNYVQASHEAEANPVVRYAVPVAELADDIIEWIVESLRGEDGINSDRDENLNELDTMMNSWKFTTTGDHIMVAGLGQGRLLEICNRTIDESEEENRRKMAMALDQGPNTAYVIDEDLFIKSQKAAESGYGTEHRTETIDEIHTLNSTATTAIHEPVQEAMEMATNRSVGSRNSFPADDITLIQLRTLREELDQKEHELETLQRDVRQKQVENEELNTLLHNTREQVRNLQTTESENTLTMDENSETSATHSKPEVQTRGRQVVRTASNSPLRRSSLEASGDERNSGTRILRRNNSPAGILNRSHNEIIYLRRLLQEEKLARKWDTDRFSSLKRENENLRKTFEDKFSFLEQKLNRDNRDSPNTLSLIRSRLTPPKKQSGVVFDSAEFRTSTKTPIGRAKRLRSDIMGTPEEQPALPRPTGVLRNKNLERIIHEECSSDDEKRVPAQFGFQPTRSGSLSTPRIVTDQSENRQPRVRRFFPVTPKNFGLSVFDEESSDLISHVEEVDRAAEEAGEMGATEFQKIRLLMMSLPKSMKYVESFVPPEKKNNYGQFSAEVVKILSDKIRQVMNKFIDTQRAPGESILKYFNRITQMYKNSNFLIGTLWENDASHITCIYTKVYQALYEGERNELDRRLDGKLENRTLTVCELKKELVDINKLSSPKIRAEKAGNSNRVLAVTENASGNSPGDRERKSTIQCYHCREPGHMRNECSVLKRQLEENPNGYRQAKQGNQRFGNQSLFRKGQDNRNNERWPRSRPQWNRPTALPRKNPNQAGIRPAPAAKPDTNNGTGE